MEAGRELNELVIKYRYTDGYTKMSSTQANKKIRHRAFTNLSRRLTLPHHTPFKV